MLEAVKAERTTIYINITKNLGDLVSSTNGIELPHKLLGHGYSEGLLGCGGLVSALLTCYQLYPARPKSDA
eukprot:GDKH01021616.1.p2 GENE.GDKH01021616.1~~GDKH01021616.1.p2  ORF type:complete len:71 (+),score=17.37 GDKH01021616.1:3-215(+)